MKWKCWNAVLLSLAIFAVLFFVEEWFAVLYYAMAPGPPAPDLVDKGKVAGDAPFTLAGHFIRHGAAVMLFTILLLRLQLVTAENLDSAHLAAARGDTTLLLGSLVARSFHYLEEIAYSQSLRMTGYTSSSLSSCRTAILLTSLTAECLQFFALRRVVALRDAELKMYDPFLPFLALASFIANFYTS
ncbi:hypothetical protein AAVH_23208 [Aphelenchoides avenae]|nr:hypothetical protein AAVH_23208 [Aphelenchus avenae]